MLEWRYDVSASLSVAPSALSSWGGGRQATSSEIVLVAFDDLSQFDLGIARFNDLRSQAVLARALQKVEAGKPTVVGIDLDLRGAVSPALVKLFQRHRNVVLSLFGSLEGSTDLPAPELMRHAAAYGYCFTMACPHQLGAGSPALACFVLGQPLMAHLYEVMASP